MSSQDGLSESTGESMAVINPSKPKRSSPSKQSSTESQSGQNQAFFFVDPASSTREKRAHVMRHHIQTKRKQTILATQADQQSRREPRVYPWMKKEGRNEARPSAKSAQGVISMATSTYPRSQTSSDSDDRAGEMDHFPAESVHKAPYDRSLPWDEDELAEMWHSRLTYWSGQNAHLKDRIYYAAAKYRFTFESTILGYCALWSFHLNRRKSDEVKFRHYESRVRQGIANKTDHDGKPLDNDTIIIAVTSLALTEDRFGDKKKAREYLRQAKDLQLRQTSRAADPFGRALVLYALTLMEPPNLAVGSIEVTKLVDFLRVARQSMEKDANSHYLEEVPQRSTTFEFDGPMFQLLSSGPRPSQVPMDSRSFVVNKTLPTTEWARTAGLIYLMLAMCEFCGNKDKVVRFLQHVRGLVLKYGLDRSLACESFMFFLFEETCAIDLIDSGRVWRASEILDIHKRLPFEWQFRFNEMILGYLMLNPPLTSVEAFERDLEASLQSPAH